MGVSDRMEEARQEMRGFFERYPHHSLEAVTHNHGVSAREAWSQAQSSAQAARTHAASGRAEAARIASADAQSWQDMGDAHFMLSEAGREMLAERGLDSGGGGAE